MPSKTYDDDLKKIDVITIFGMIKDLSDGLMSQAKATNNNVAAILRTNMQLQETITNLIKNLTDTRDQRYQQEIDDLEAQMAGMLKMIEEKKAAKVDNKSTGERLQEIAKEAVSELQEAQEAERKKRSIDWYAVRDAAVKGVVSALAIALVLWLASNAPGIGELIKSIFGK